MQSSGASGAGVEGFDQGKGQKNWRLRHNGKTASGKRRRVGHSITLAVAGTAFAAASLFILYDACSTLSHVKRDLALMGNAVAARVANVATNSVEETLAGSLNDYPGIVHASFVQAGEPSQQPFFSEVVSAGEHGLLAVEAEQSSAIVGIAGRGAAALALAGLMTAFTLRRRREDDLEDAPDHRDFEFLTATLPMGAAFWDAEGRMIVCNESYRSRLKIAGSDMVYADVLGRLLTGGYLKLLREDQGNRLLELHQADGSCLVLEERPLDNGGFMTLVSDETKRRQTDILLTTIREEQRQLARRYHEEKIRAEAASRAKTNFLAHLSHDIRTPLNHIIGFAELMGRETYGKLGDPRYAEYVQSIRSSGEHLLNSFAAILDLAELENGQKVLLSETVRVDEVVTAVCRRFRGQIKRAGLHLDIKAECGAALTADRLALVRMVSNIVENAIRFTPPGGRLTLATFAAEDGVVIEVTDTGIGMSEDRLSSLSQPFALGDATFTRDGVGPGLGISISRAIAELSGGRMVIDSAPSVGTTVAISLPIGSDMAETTVAA